MTIRKSRIKIATQNDRYIDVDDIVMFVDYHPATFGSLQRWTVLTRFGICAIPFGPGHSYAFWSDE